MLRCLTFFHECSPSPLHQWSQSPDRLAPFDGPYHLGRVEPRLHPRPRALLLREANFAKASLVARCLYVATASAIVVAVVPVPEVPRSLEYAIHQLGGGIMFAALMTAMFLTPRRIAGPLASVAVLATAVAGGFFILAIGMRIPLVGLIQRVMLYGTCVWLTAGSWRVARR